MTEDSHDGPKPEETEQEAYPLQRAASALPSLSNTPIMYSGCCFAISNPLIAHLAALLPNLPSLTLSIGSGSGLLEALLLAAPHECNIIGVEISPTVNIYLPTSHHRTVLGSRFLDPLAAEAGSWMFVYPKRVGLVREYLQAFGDGAVTVVLWAGPMIDWEDFKDTFQAPWQLQISRANEYGGKPWDLIITATKEMATAVDDAH